MNRKQFALLLFLFVVLGLGGLIIYNRQNNAGHEGNAELGKKLLPNFPVNDVTQISLKQDTNELNLVKKDGLWRVHERADYPASYSQISEFLLKLGDMKIVQTEKVGSSQLSRLELAPGHGTNSPLAVDFKNQSGKSFQTLLLGKKHMQKSTRPSPLGEMGEGGWPDGRYVKTSPNSDMVCLISDALSNVEPKPEQWLNKDFFKVEKVRSVAVDFPVTTTNSWKLARESETGEWKLADARPDEKLDSTKTSSVSNPLSAPSFSDIETGAKPDQIAKPTVITLDTFDNFTYLLKVGQKTNDNYPVALNVSAQLAKERIAGKDEKPEDKARLDKEFKEKQGKLQEKLDQEKGYENWVYLVSSWTLDPLLKDRAQFLVEKKEEKKPAAPAANATNAPPAAAAAN